MIYLKKQTCFQSFGEITKGTAETSCKKHKFCLGMGCIANVHYLLIVFILAFSLCILLLCSFSLQFSSISHSYLCISCLIFMFEIYSLQLFHLKRKFLAHSALKKIFCNKGPTGNFITFSQAIKYKSFYT